MSHDPTSKSGPKERRFLDALRELFVGAKVDGKSGYINLMRIKASYFQKAVEVDGQAFFFDCSSLELKKSNEKRELVYTFEKIEKKKDVQVVRLTAAYSQSGRKTKIDDILKALHKAGLKVGEATLDKAMRIFIIKSRK